MPQGRKAMRYPSSYTAEKILPNNEARLMLTTGPGVPAENVELIENIRKVAGKLPIFGICL